MRWAARVVWLPGAGGEVAVEPALFLPVVATARKDSGRCDNGQKPEASIHPSVPPGLYPPGSPADLISSAQLATLAPRRLRWVGWGGGGGEGGGQEGGQ